MANYQPSLFSAAELPGNYLSQRSAPLQMAAETLQAWKQRILQHQQRVKVRDLPQQATLCDGELAGAEHLADQIDPFKLPQQNAEFWRWKAEDAGVAALYFVIDDDASLLLYVGETVKSNLRWKGDHDCKRYILQYVAAHRQFDLPVRVNIGFWADAPVDTRDRQALESALIYKWRSPFNKQNWSHWHTPFVI